MTASETVVGLENQPLVHIETCHSTWVFDEARHLFRRLLKGHQLSAQISTGWRSYDHLVLDDQSDSFLVMLDASGTRLLRSWRHLAGVCTRCGEAMTQELSLKELENHIARAAAPTGG